MSGRTIETVRLRRVTPPGDVATLTPTIIKQLLDLIQSGQLRLGSRLPPERELALALGVSRPSVRQAVKALEAMGIIVCRVGSGNFITSDVSASRLLSGPIRFAVKANHVSREDLYEMRRLMEVQITGLAAERAKAQHLAAIRHSVEEMERAKTDFRLLAQWDLRFHLAILRACGNDVFQMLYEPIYHLLWEDLAERMNKFDPEFVVREHWAIYEAIAARRRVEAMKITLKHLQIGYRKVLSRKSRQGQK
jgi:GntR family transcriptional repressor for pyruvate dehydrogenase complex